MTPTPGQTQARMVLIENTEQDFNGIEFLDWLLGFRDPEATETAVIAESERAFILAESHYQRVSNRVAVLNPRMIAQIGFIQGATFAAAALGRRPYPNDPPSPFDVCDECGEERRALIHTDTVLNPDDAVDGLRLHAFDDGFGDDG